MPAIPFLSLGIWRVTGSAWAWWLIVAVAFVVIPVVDFLVGDDHSNIPEQAAARLQEVRYYRWLTYLYLPLQYAGLVMAGSVWAGRELDLIRRVHARVRHLLFGPQIDVARSFQQDGHACR